MRVSDAERAEVADELSKHFGEGRLDEAELNERLSRAMSAKTRADLAGLLDDLPRPLAAAAPPVPVRSRSTTWLGLLLVAFVALSVASAVSSWHLPLVLIFVAGLLLWRRHHRHLHRWHGGHPWHHWPGHWPGHWPVR
ncbi:MAG: DUF1707 domain-containing protein [Actinomycetota bacterium]|nr:DUF1707 domain-containing protein [Actinomycetota bacterium]